MRPIAASGVVAAEPEAVFAFLSDLRRHWELTGRFAVLTALTGPADAPTGGTVLLRGPLGLRRTVRIAVAETRPPRELHGTADLAPATRARVRWTVDPDGAARCAVGLQATVLEASTVDRLLLAAGGRAWLRRRLAGVIARLGERVAGAGPAPAVTDVAPSRVLAGSGSDVL